MTPALLPCCPAPAALAPPTRLLLGCFAFRQRVNSAAAGVACVLNGNSVAGVFFGFPTGHRSTAGAQGLALKDDVEGTAQGVGAWAARLRDTRDHIFCFFWCVTTRLNTYVADDFLVGQVPVKRHRHWHWHRLGCNDDLPASSPPALSVTCACVLVLWFAVTTHSACGHALFVWLESSGACIMTTPSTRALSMASLDCAGRTTASIGSRWAHI